MPLRSNKVEDGYVLVDGGRVHFERAGDGPPLILLHGLVGSSRNWFRNIEALASSMTVYAIDLLNMGESDRVSGLDASLEATADRVVAMMDALGIETADVAGHSHGGAVSMTLAARHPNRVRRLVLFAPANPFCDLGQQLIRFYETAFGSAFARLIPVMPEWTKAIALGRMYGDPARVPAEALEGYTAGLRVSGTIHHILSIVRCWTRDMSRLRAILPALERKPALLIWGDRDRAVGLQSAKELQRVLRRSQLLVLPGVGHIPFEEMPDACNRAMLEFLLPMSVSGVRSAQSAMQMVS